MAPHSGGLLKVPPGALAGASLSPGLTLAEHRWAGSYFWWGSLLLDDGSAGGFEDEAGPCPCEWVAGGLVLGIGRLLARPGDEVHG